MSSRVRRARHRWRWLGGALLTLAVALAGEFAGLSEDLRRLCLVVAVVALAILALLIPRLTDDDPPPEPARRPRM